LKLEGQLLVLQNARVAEYEQMLDNATNRQSAKDIRAAYVEETSQLQHELALLRDHLAATRQQAKDEPFKGAGVAGHNATTTITNSNNKNRNNDTNNANNKHRYGCYIGPAVGKTHLWVLSTTSI
jgi:predicted SprT family Zn-dependent metalloprotease